MCSSIMWLCPSFIIGQKLFSISLTLGGFCDHHDQGNIVEVTLHQVQESLLTGLATSTWKPAAMLKLNYPETTVL